MSTNNGSPTIEINCSCCFKPMRVHAPGAAHSANKYISQVSVFPTWSLDERICPDCSTMNVCAIKTFETVWITLQEKQGEKPSLIVVPSLVVPKLS